jgi:DNA-binding transcriptional ArsR family regulator
VTGVCRALAHPARRALLQALTRGECDVSNLSASSGLDQPTVSKHLRALRTAGLVQVRVDGRRRCYSLASEVTVRRLLELLTEIDAGPRRPPVLDAFPALPSAATTPAAAPG